MTKTLAITGGTGFVGSKLLDVARLHKYHIRALTRRDQEPCANVTWVRGALDDPTSLSELVAGADAVVHVAGVISARNRAGFEAGNALGTLNMVEAAKTGGVRRFVHVSSLAAREPDLSDYGWSKARGETIVKASGLDWTIVRPPAVYGPGDTETLALFKMAKRGLVLLPPKGRLSLIEVGDLCNLIVAVLPYDECVGQVYEPDDGTAGGWEHRAFAGMLGQAFGRRTRGVAVGRALMTTASLFDRMVHRGKAKLTADRVRYMLHPDWVVSADARPPIPLWRPRVRTPGGLKATADWYRAKGWIR